jgi:hypothetical protein
MKDTSRTGLTKNRWEYLKALEPTASRYLHVSAHARMIADPRGPMFPLIPWIQRPGMTFNAGRNKAKREKRARRFGGGK